MVGFCRHGVPAGVRAEWGHQEGYSGGGADQQHDHAEMRHPPLPRCRHLLQGRRAQLHGPLRLH